MPAPFQLPPLPYAQNALEPVISAETMSFHYGKHHKAYIDKLNDLVKGTRFEKMELEEIIRESHDDATEKAIFNNAAQAWNHLFFWHSMSPKTQAPATKLAQMIQVFFGSIEEFHKKFAEAANGQFGSGWAWLLATPDNKLRIVTTSNAETPLVGVDRPLLCLDVWEHAYYLDYQNRRPDFTSSVVERLLNWSFAEANLENEAPNSEVFTARQGLNTHPH